MYKEDLALNNLQWLIHHQTKPNLMKFSYNENVTGLRIFCFLSLVTILPELSSLFLVEGLNQLLRFDERRKYVNKCERVEFADVK